MKWLLSVLVFVLVSCGSVTKTPYRIAVDPSWYPMDLMGKEANVFAFSNELLKAISESENIPLERVNVSWDHILAGLQRDEYDAMLSPLPPYNFNLSKYDFSKIYLETGFVLIVPQRGKAGDLDDMKNQEVAVQMNSEAESILRKYPDVIPRFYDNPASALNQLSTGKFDGVVLEVIPAVSFIDDLYVDKLKIAGAPLNEMGLRLIAVKDKRKELLEHFDRGLKRLKRNGTYDELVRKWGVGIAD